MLARAPASSANLGPGFDVLAVALALYVEVEVSPAEVLTLDTTGHGSDLPADATHMAVEVATAVAGHDRLSIRIHSDIPVGRGLGSSAALAVATAAAAGAADPLEVGVRIDGHPENAAASATGGLVAATTVDGRTVTRSLALDPELRFVVAVPDVVVRTRDARAVLPASVPLGDAAFNLGRLALALSGLADHRLLAPEAMGDRLHQAPRSLLFPASSSIIASMLDAGALAACWSGAGPSMLGLATPASSAHVAATARQAMSAASVGGEVLVLEAATTGVTVQPPTGH